VVEALAVVFSVGSDAPVVLVGEGGVLQHEGVEGSEISTTNRRENEHGQSSPRWGTNNDGGSDFDSAGSSLVEGLDRRQGEAMEGRAQSGREEKKKKRRGQWRGDGHPFLNGAVRKGVGVSTGGAMWSKD
jgi:hypothetical protein